MLDPKAFNNARETYWEHGGRALSMTSPDRLRAAITAYLATLEAPPEPVGEGGRRSGNSKLVYNKTTRTIDTVRTTPEARNVAWRWRDDDDRWQATCDEDRASHEFRVHGREIHDLFDAALTHPAPSNGAVERDGWRSMDSAPKDGTLILIRRTTQWTDDTFAVVRWDDDWWQVHDGKNDHPLRGPEPEAWFALTLPAALKSQTGGDHA